MKVSIELKSGKKKFADPQKIMHNLSNALDEAAIGAKEDFDRTTATWNRQVAFEINRKEGEREVATNDKIYGYVNFGTKAHLISPKPGGVLRFRGVYSVKTIPNQLYSLQGGASGDAVFTRLPVLHPGAKPRRFDKAVAKLWTPKLVKLLGKALKSK